MLAVVNPALYELVVQAYQHIYLGLLYGLLAIKSILLDDFQSISTGSIGPVSISKLTKQEKAIFWGGKLLWLAYFIVLPAVRSHHSWAALAALWLLSEAVTGWILALMFQVSIQHSLFSRVLLQAAWYVVHGVFP